MFFFLIVLTVNMEVLICVVVLYIQLHMLGDGSRGAVIEMTLAKILYMSSKCQRLCLITSAS